MQIHNRQRLAAEHSCERRGFLLAVVLVVIVLASLVCYQFAERMTTERQIVSMYKLEAQARQAAESGVDFLLAMLSDPEFDALNVATLPAEDYAWQIVQPADETAEQPNALYCVLVSREGTVREAQLKFGLSAEGGKINLNGLVQLDVEEAQQREMLMSLPNMTETLADTILDFIDADTTPREYGTESDEGDFVVRNGPLTSLDDLLAIPEVTAALLYGEDANRNGLLDPMEDDGALREPVDNADGVLDLGWEAYLTLWSRESNLRPDGTPKINVNSDDLETLEQELIAEFGDAVAKFIIAYRKNGPYSTNTDSGSGGAAGNNNSGGGSSGGGNSGSNSGGGSGRSGGGGNSQNSGGGQTGGGRQSGGSSQSGGGGQSGSNSGSGNRSSGQGSSSVGGTSAGTGGVGGAGGAGGAGTAGRADGDSSGSGSAQVRIVSLYEFIDAQVEETPEGGGESEMMTSPWLSSDLTFLQQMEETLTIDETETREGRMDINFAARESLLGLPEIPEALVEEIVNGAGTWESVGDLLQKGVVDVEQLKKLEPFLTTRSRTYRMTSYGLWQTQGPIVRMEVVFDRAAARPIILQMEDLSILGTGFSREELLPADLLPAGP